MLTTDQFKVQIKEWMKQEKWDLVRASSNKRLQAKGYIDLGVGSFVRWIEPEWFEEAKKRDVIARDTYGNWIPRVDVRIEEEITGRKGRDVFTKEKQVIDASKYKKFMKDYEEYSEKKRGREYFDQQAQKENQAMVQGFTF